MRTTLYVGLRMMCARQQTNTKFRRKIDRCSFARSSTAPKIGGYGVEVKEGAEIKKRRKPTEKNKIFGTYFDLRNACQLLDITFSPGYNFQSMREIVVYLFFSLFVHVWYYFLALGSATVPPAQNHFVVYFQYQFYIYSLDRRLPLFIYLRSRHFHTLSCTHRSFHFILIAVGFAVHRNADSLSFDSIGQNMGKEKTSIAKTLLLSLSNEVSGK